MPNPAQRHRKPTILLVDDQKNALDTLYELMYIHFGKEYRIETAESGNEALELLKDLHDEEREVVLIQSDCIMPGGITGDDFLVKAHRIYPLAVKVLHSGQCDVSQIIKALRFAEMFRFIVLPYDTDDYILQISEGLTHYHNRKAFHAFLSEQEKEQIQQSIT